MLQAFVENDWQYFYTGKCTFMWRSVDQKISSVIHSPIITYVLLNNVYSSVSKKMEIARIYMYFDTNTHTMEYAKIYEIPCTGEKIY